MNEAIARELFSQDVGKIPDKLIIVRNWKLYSREFPVLDIGFLSEGLSEMRVRLIARNWNDEPPSVELLDSDGHFLSAAQLPKRSGTVFNGSAHPSTGRPFVCMAGTLEYHTHTSHVRDLWENYKRKDSHTLGGIVTQLWNSWLKG